MKAGYLALYGLTRNIVLWHECLIRLGVSRTQHCIHILDLCLILDVVLGDVDL